MRVSRVSRSSASLFAGLYTGTSSQPRPVSRDQAADGVGVARHVAKFHLDKLADDGLLDVTYARPEGRRGPGAGRPTKLYRRSSRELAVSLPERRYDPAGRLLAAAVTPSQRDDVPVRDALRQAATELGAAIGNQVRERAGSSQVRRPCLPPPATCSTNTATSQGLTSTG